MRLSKLFKKPVLISLQLLVWSPIFYGCI